MNQLFEKGLLTEIPCGLNFAYVIEDNSEFLSTDYKVLLSQQNKNFISCMKMYYNGKIQLFYLTSEYQTFESILPKLNAESFVTIATNLLAAIVEVKSNGFLSIENINIDRSYIFVDQNTFRVSLVYIPMATAAYMDAFAFENELRTGMIRLINEMPNIQSNRTLEFVDELASGSSSLEDIYHYIKGGKIHRQHGGIPGQTPMRPQTAGPVGMPGPMSMPGPMPMAGPMGMGGAPAGMMRPVTMVAMNAPTRVEISITKSDFVIGKGSNGTDAIISFNNAISRKHCKITEQNRQYFITDLQSANGTYLNREKLLPNQPYPLKNGDIIRLANSDFQINIG